MAAQERWVVSKYESYMADMQTAWCEQVRTATSDYEAMAARAPTEQPSAAKAVGGALADNHYVDPDIIVRALKGCTDRIGVEIGDLDVIERRTREAAESAELEDRMAARQAVDKAKFAASTGDADVLSALLEARPSLATDVLGSPPGGGQKEQHLDGQHTLLTLACECNHPACVALLCAGGADPNYELTSYSPPSRNRSATSHSMRPLHLTLRSSEQNWHTRSEEPAVGTARLTIVSSLLAHNASVTAKPQKGGVGRVGPRGMGRRFAQGLRSAFGAFGGKFVIRPPWL